MSVREILEIPQNESINLLIDNAVRVGGAEPTGTIQIESNGLYDVAPYAAANVNVPEPSGSISITQNGTVDVKNYASANVNVPQGVFPSGSLSITENGNYDVTNYAGANVNVPQGVFPSGSLSITENGNYDVTNYAGANVNVPKLPGTIKYVDIIPDSNTTQLVIPKPADNFYALVVNEIEQSVVGFNQLTIYVHSRFDDPVTYWTYGSYCGGNLQLYFGNPYAITEDDDNITITISSGSTRFTGGKTYRAVFFYVL